MNDGNILPDVRRGHSCLRVGSLAEHARGQECPRLTLLRNEGTRRDGRKSTLRNGTLVQGLSPSETCATGTKPARMDI
jgi:hypothetical protein